MRFGTTHRLLSCLLLVAGLSTGCILSPQPDPPGANIVTSAADRESDVAVIGGAGSVPPGTAVRVDDTEDDGAWAGGDASENGGFVVVLPSGPGHTLSVTYTIFEDGEWRQSAVRTIVVDRYDPVPDPLASEDGDYASPFAPGMRASGGLDSSLRVDAPVSGYARVWCPDECVQPGIRVILANRDRGEVLEVVHAGGVFEQPMRASVGDVLLVFAVLADHPTQTSSLVHLVVPAP
jgi:hypothetical protein